MTTLYLHGRHVRPDGNKDTFWAQEVEHKVAPLKIHVDLLVPTSKYGNRFPTVHMVKFNNCWRRVYVRAEGTRAVWYIGEYPEVGEQITVQQVNR